MRAARRGRRGSWAREARAAAGNLGPSQTVRRSEVLAPSSEVLCPTSSYAARPMCRAQRAAPT
eukprot:8847671-Pyramimonas_sp.AAC.1